MQTEASSACTQRRRAALYDGAVFDWDGTLLDTMEMWEHVGAQYLSGLGISPAPDVDEVLRRMDMHECGVYLREAYRLPYTAAEVVEGINRFVADTYLHHAQPKPGVPAFLERMYACGIPMAIATATERSVLLPALQRFGWMKYFSPVVTCSDVGCSKKKPDVYIAASADWKLPRARVAVFEDAMHGARTAHAAGFGLIGVAERFEPEEEALRALADVFLTDFRDAAALFGCPLPPLAEGNNDSGGMEC